MKLAHLLAAVTALVSAASIAAESLGYWDRPVRDRETVAAVQKTLAADGYDPGPVNGQFGPKTVQAVKQAQKDRELEPTGRLDRRTVAALGISEAESASAGASGRGEQR